MATENTLKIRASGGKLTPAQVKNWRNVLIGIIGPYASIMSDDEIEQFKKHVESEVNKQPNIKAEPHGAKT